MKRSARPAPILSLRALSLIRRAAIALCAIPILALALALFAPLRPLHAEPAFITPPKHATRISLDEGLSQTTVTAILQARDGRIWFATGDGVNLFDGTSFQYLFRKLGNPNGLQSNSANALFQDKSGAIWVGTLGGGLSKFKEDGTHLASFSLTNESLPSNDIYDITQSPDGAIWVATGVGVARLLPGEPTFARIYSLPREATQTLLALPDGSILIGTATNGLIRLSPEERQTESFTRETSSLPGNAIAALLLDRAGRVWIGTQDGGPARFTPETNSIDTPFTLPDPDIEAIAEGFDGRLWFGSSSTGLFVWDPLTGALENHRANPAIYHRLASDRILSLAPDRTGRMWVGTYGSGAASLSQFADSFTSFKADPNGQDGPRSGVIRSLAEAPDSGVWVGTRDGLYRLDRATSRFRELPLRTAPTQASDVGALLAEPNGLLIAANPHGLMRYTPLTGAVPVTAPGASKAPLFTKDYIRLLMRDTQGRLWVGTVNGLVLLASDNSELARFSGAGGAGDLPSDRIRALYEAPDGTIWVGTSAGLSRYLPQTSSFETLSGPDILPEGDVRALLQIDPDTLLVATGGGLSRIDLPTRTARFILRNDGLPNETLFSLMPDAKGDVWITTNNGLARYSPGSGAIQSFYSRDGLPSNEFNFNAYARLTDGSIAVGGIDGVALFDPIRLSPNSLPPITSLRINPPQSAHQHRLTPPNSLDVTIGLRHFDDPKRNTLRWRLDPIDTQWSSANGPTHTITRDALPAGNYTLRYIAVSAGGAIAPEGQFTFRIAQSPFKSWYAYLAYCALLVLSLWAFATLRIAQISRRNEDLSAKISDQTRALEDANARLQNADIERARFYARTAHEIRTPLSLIKAPLQKILASPTLEPNERRLVQMIERAAKRMVQLIDEIASVAQEKSAIPSGQATVDLDRFFAPIIALYRDTAVSRGQSLIATHSGPATATFDIGAVETITHNLLSNAIRYAPEGTHIHLITTFNEAALTLRVANGGAGLTPPQIAHLTAYATDPTLPLATRGLELIGSAVLRAGGTLTVDPTRPDITITLPAFFTAEDPAATASRAARILIVEDNAELRDYLLTLTSAIAVPTAVGSLKAARRAVLRNNFELILCDVVLPDGSGFDFAQTVKTDPDTSHIGLVFLTALADAASRREGLNAWADGYITKPFEAEDLLTKLRIRLRAHDRLRAHLAVRALSDTPHIAPDSSPSIDVVPLDQRLLAQFQSYLEDNYADPEASLTEAAKHCAMSKRALQRKLETLYHKSFSALLIETRMAHASAHLRAGTSATETAERCGYSTLSSFSRQFKDHFGQSPRDFVKTLSQAHTTT